MHGSEPILTLRHLVGMSWAMASTDGAWHRYQDCRPQGTGSRRSPYHEMQRGGSVCKPLGPGCACLGSVPWGNLSPTTRQLMHS